MRTRAQIGMVLTLDKCIGCHTCSVTCKTVWTSRDGVEYAWFNNVETKPGTGYPTDWENQARWNGGWERTRSGKLQPKQSAKRRILANNFANPDLPEADIYALEEQYVMLFDRSRTLSLDLFEHVHGESRDRGGAMVSLVETYRAGGFDPATPELPDHLSVLRAFLSTRPYAEVQETLADAAHIFEALEARLSRRKSPYSAVFAALLQLAGVRADAQAVAGLLDQPEVDPDDREALDAVWEESEVRFGPDPNAGCPVSRDMLARMDITPDCANGAAAE